MTISVIDPDATRRKMSTQPTAPRPSKIIPVKIPGKQPHDIIVGCDILGDLPACIESLGLSRNVFIISSPTIFGLHGERMRALFNRDGWSVDVATFPDGEENKTVQAWYKLSGDVASAETTREAKVLVLNLGGGVVGDVGAFVAACYDRGRDYVQVPTTLLGDVDCGIGGKCGVNHASGKNKIGQFHQPRLVLAELSFLRTLPRREIQSGLAEVIKYGVSLDAKLFDALEELVPRIIGMDMSAVEQAVIRCFELKTGIVVQDERDTLGIRAKLNFGHTVGHALEAATNYARYRHGEAIAIGMVCACDIAVRLKMIPLEMTSRVEALCKQAGLPTFVSSGVSVDSIMSFMRHDKKFVGGVKNKFVLPTAIGATTLVPNIDEGLIRDVLRIRSSA